MNALARALGAAMLAAALASPCQAAVTLAAARIWPAPEYTRITLEAADPLVHKVFSLQDPPRLIVDIEDVEGSAVLDGLAARISPDDPYVRSVRIGRFRPGIVRMVFDLKTDVRPQSFLLRPVGEYGYRLVLDLYPAQPVDPLMALLRDAERSRAALPEQAAQPPLPNAGNGAGRPEPVPPAAEAPPPEPAASTPRTATGGPERAAVIAIDAGHGGEDPGARGRLGTSEKDVTLSIARRLKELVDATPGMRGFLVRDGDYFVPLHHRVMKARAAQADVFVSIHADAFIKPHARGSSVFALSERGATSAAARWLAKRENDADLIGGVNIDVPDPMLKQVLLDLSQTATINDGLKLGRAVLHELGQINTLHKRHVEQAGFAVLKAPDIPSILVETAFISNPEEEERLRDEEYQDRMARSLLAGLQRYLARNPPLAPAPVTAAANAPRAADPALTERSGPEHPPGERTAAPATPPDGRAGVVRVAMQVPAPAATAPRAARAPATPPPAGRHAARDKRSTHAGVPVNASRRAAHAGSARTARQAAVRPPSSAATGCQARVKIDMRPCPPKPSAPRRNAVRN